MNISQEGINLIKSFESCSLKAYADSKGKIAIGWGHTGAYAIGQVCTQEQADQWLQDDLQNTCKEITLICKIHSIILSQNQFDAMVSLCYNIGLTQLYTSQLFLRLSQKDPKASWEFYNWIHMDKIIAGGLVKRRESEKALFDK